MKTYHVALVELAPEVYKVEEYRQIEEQMQEGNSED